MGHIKIYACASNATMSAAHELPSPTSVQGSNEQIWSEDTGRAQEGANQAQMIGKSITAKQSYNIKWDILATDRNSTASQKLDKIRNGLTRGFFKFGIAMGDSVPTGFAAYRSEIAYNMEQGDEPYFSNVTVQVIEK